MSVISTGNHPKALWPGINSWFGQKYKEHPMECSQVFDTTNSNKAYEEDVESAGFGLAPVKAQGGAVSYDTHSQGNTKRYTHVAYGLGYIVTREEMDDNLYTEVSMKRAAALAFSMRQTKETVAANIFNRGFDAAYTGADGKELFATDHPVLGGGTQSNELAVAADLSEASLEDLLIQIMQAKDARGLKISLIGRKLIVPPALSFTAARIVQSDLQNDTANNAINAIKATGLLPEGVMTYHYLTDTDAWFVKTNAPDGLKHMQRVALEFSRDKDFDTDNAKAKAYERYSYGWTDWRGVYGTPGAA